MVLGEANQGEEKLSRLMIGNIRDSPTVKLPFPSLLYEKQRKTIKVMISILVTLVIAETVIQRWINVNDGSIIFFAKGLNKGGSVGEMSRTEGETNATAKIHVYQVRDHVLKEYEEWYAKVRNLTSMTLSPTGWEPNISDWSYHKKERRDRFLSVEERIDYYMDKWCNQSIPMFGKRFEKDTFIPRKSTRDYETFSDIMVNLYNLDREKLYECYTRKKELHVMSPYCRDYIDLAILHSEGSANVVHYIGDTLPTYIPEEILRYPIFSKVRPLCRNTENNDFVNKICRREKRPSPIVLPLNRKRHYSMAAIVPENDIPLENKLAKAVWRGAYGKTHLKISDTHDLKYALVSNHLNSSLVDAKFSKHTDKAPPYMVATLMNLTEQLKYKYVVSVEGNDVSSGLKWMLFSNSVVLAPAFTWESWAMEGTLKPFVHFIPLKADMSNVEEMIQWAESHPHHVRLIAERSTLFIYDLLFHPDAARDEILIMEGIMGKFERNFGFSDNVRLTHPLNLKWDQSDHPEDRDLRFPSVEERVKYYMGDWYNIKDGVRSMKRKAIEYLPKSLRNNDISRHHPFIASGKSLSLCATFNESPYPQEIRLACQDSLPYFDERNTADLKSNSFKRLRKTKKGKGMILVPESSWADGDRGRKDSKRVLLDDSIKILYFGDQPWKGDMQMPFFAKLRGTLKSNNDAILWPLELDDNDIVRMMKSGFIEANDYNFSNKKPEAIGKTNNGTNDHIHHFTSMEGNNSFSILNSAESHVDNVEDQAPFIQTSRGDSSGTDLNIAGKKPQLEQYVREMLSYRYLVATVHEDQINHDLKWMLLSQSVVFMSNERVVTSWFMEMYLQPYVHYIPISHDYSDIREKVLWCEQHPDYVRKISERATLFVHDMFFDIRSEKDNQEVQFRMMERYVKLYG